MIDIGFLGMSTCLGLFLSNILKIFAKIDFVQRYY